MPHLPASARYRDVFFDVVSHAASALGVTLAMLGLDAALGALHARPTAFHDAARLLLHYAQALPAILAFVGASLMLLLGSMLLDRWTAVRSLRDRLVLPAVQTAEHMVTLGLGIFGAWALMERDASGLADLTGLGSVLALGLGLGLLLGAATLCAAVVQFMQVDYPRLLARHGRRRYPAVIAALLVLFALLYWDLVWRYPGLPAAH